MIQKLIEKLNKKRLKERISSAIVMVALIVSISGVVGAVSGIIVSNRYNYALKNYGFSQGDIGKMMITFADTRSYLRAAIGYQDENLVNSCAENYEKKKESCQQYTKEVKNTVSSADEKKIYNSITEKLNDYFDTCDAVLEKGKNTQDIDAIITSEFTKPQKIKKKPANAYVCGFSFYFKENIKQYKNTRKKVYR